MAETADAAMRSAMRVGDLADLDFSATFEGQKKGSPSPYEVPATALAPASLQLRPGAFLTLRVISTTHQVPVTALKMINCERPVRHTLQIGNTPTTHNSHPAAVRTVCVVARAP